MYIMHESCDAGQHEGSNISCNGVDEQPRPSLMLPITHFSEVLGVLSSKSSKAILPKRSVPR